MHRRSARGRRPRLTVLALTAIAALALAAPAAEGQQCASGGTSALPPPEVDFLRVYRAPFRSTARLAADSLGRIYVVDPAKGTAWVRAADGRLLARRDGLGQPISITVAAGGDRIWLGDGEDGRVTAYDASWRRLFDAGQGVGELAFPSDLALDPATGNLWVADGHEHRVRVFDAGGTALFSFGEEGTGAGQFQYPMGIFVDAARAEVLVADQVNGRIQVFDLDGNFKFCLGRKGAGFGRFILPQGLWADAAGRIYVADVFDGRVQVIDRQGALVAFLGETGTAPGQLSAPIDLLVDPSGRLFVSSSTTARLEIFGLDGYDDPERFAPAEVGLRPATVDRSTATTVTAVLEVPFYSLDLVDLGSIAANGVAALPGSVTVGDLDGDHEPDLAARFSGAALAATLPPAGGSVRFTGQLGALELEGFADLEVVGEPGGDSDGDGIPDGADLCAGTAAESPVDDQGCSVDQLCPCDGPAAGGTWRNHGQYVSCVAIHLRDISHPPLDPATRRSLIAAAAKSDCGR